MRIRDLFSKIRDLERNHLESQLEESQLIFTTLVFCTISLANIESQFVLVNGGSIVLYPFLKSKLIKFNLQN